jgi:hypothetical protein
MRRASLSRATLHQLDIDAMHAVGKARHIVRVEAALVDENRQRRLAM